MPDPATATTTTRWGSLLQYYELERPHIGKIEARRRLYHRMAGRRGATNVMRHWKWVLCILDSVDKKRRWE